MLGRLSQFSKRSAHSIRANNCVSASIRAYSAQFSVIPRFIHTINVAHFGHVPHRGITVPNSSKTMSSISLQSAKIRSTTAYVLDRLRDICNELGIDPELVQVVRSKVETHYNEPHRAYHNLTHINTLLDFSATYREGLHNSLAVDLAIIFHDIIYDPKSSTNEEDSAALFMALFDDKSDPQLLETVNHYILETKKHSVQDSTDSDLKLFIDFDMSILGVDREAYIQYARQVRKEYDFVPEADYCRGRAAVLLSFLAGGDIYATEEGKSRWEAQARENIVWECAVLSGGNLV